MQRWHSSPAARIICPPLAAKFHTCSAICIFRFVHAGAKNRLKFISPLRVKLCEAWIRNIFPICEQFTLGLTVKRNCAIFAVYIFYGVIPYV